MRRTRDSRDLRAAFERGGRRIRRARHLVARLQRDLACYLFVLPALAIYGTFTLWPMVSGVVLSLYDWTGIGDNSRFIGFANYQEVAADPYFWNAFRNSFAYMFGVVPIQLFLALVVAVILNDRRLRGRSFYRTLFLLVVTNTAIVGVVMAFIFSPLFGPVNLFLVRLGVLTQGVNWLGTGQTALGAVILVAIWKNVGLHMIYWLAALQTVPEELYEAGKVNGANGWQLFRFITVPAGILPIGVIIVVLALVGALKVFDLIKAMTDGGPFFATEVITLYIYRFAFSAETGAVRLGYAAAAAVFFGVVTMLLAILQGLAVRKARDWRSNP